ncbi:MAG TPA: hypothetical protein VIH99_13900 [Bdellovibrionota bacterium]|jgi:hypothetical protein
MKVFFVLSATLLVSAQAFALPRPRHPCSYTAAHAAALEAQNRLTNEVMGLNGVNGIGVAACDPYSLEKIAGLTRPEAPNVCGVVVYFRDKDNAWVPAGRIVKKYGRTLQFEGKEVSICGKVVGDIRPR